ncbi:Predicted oxidoreductase [Palleronia salina]|uniref:Predicted oxidoreductase n=1 Tax=Palleronia salina TaxID=313368 RepID=A0A1M6KWV4_9RHOB|nr:aldo/keto reductase [Palleronia salina]SHJ63441.1 Predicted oxidoreductase [Palleronia salina]
MTDITAPDGTPLSSFCFGAMQFGGKADHDASHAMYLACREAGINFFDTAHVYTDGTSETWLGEFAASERDKLVIASKANYPGGAGRDNILKSVDDSLSRLKMDMIDVYYLHRWDGDTPLEESFAALAEIQKAGKIRHVAVSNFAAWQVMKAQAVAKDCGTRIDMIQPMYNLVKRQAEVELLPMCQSEGIAAAPYSPLGGGLLTGKYRAGGEGRITESEMYSKRYSQDWMHNTAADLNTLALQMRMDPATLAVAWAARHPGVTAPIISARDVDQLQPSLAAKSFEMDDALYARISSLSPTPPPATDRLEEA